MPRPTIQIGDEVREMTKAEHDQWLLDVEEAKTRLAARQAKQAAAESARAKLAALGLSETEIKALVG